MRVSRPVGSIEGLDRVWPTRQTQRGNVASRSNWVESSGLYEWVFRSLPLHAQAFMITTSGVVGESGLEQPFFPRLVKLKLPLVRVKRKSRPRFKISREIGLSPSSRWPVSCMSDDSRDRRLDLTGFDCQQKIPFSILADFSPCRSSFRNCIRRIPLQFGVDSSSKLRWRWKKSGSGNDLRIQYLGFTKASERLSNISNGDRSPRTCPQCLALFRFRSSGALSHARNGRSFPDPHATSAA